jgi:2-polyprenyl-3-methyl-5-hydroxy-6-metoxy-1,4-benzoquinol methylase
MAEFILDYYKNENNYSDGTQIEDDILNIVMNKAHMGPDHQHSVSWPILYHLSPLRENILNWYPFKKNCSILEVGSGCGAITGLLCRRASSVVSVELTEKRARINYERHKEYNNLSIYVGNLDNMQFQDKFDYVIINGVLEYAGEFISSENPYKQFLTTATSSLKNNGILLLTIENRLGLKYFSGAKEDHLGQLFIGLDDYKGNNKIRTFSKQEISNLIEDCDLAVSQFFYPYPDYKLPEVIFTEEGYSRIPISYDNHSFDTDRYLFFDEIRMQKVLTNEKISSVFANSFLIEAGKIGKMGQQAKDIIYVKLNSNRDDNYKICTIILKQGHTYKVMKRALEASAIGHLKRMYDFYLQNKTKKDCLLPAEWIKNDLIFEYLEYETVENILLKLESEKKQEEFLQILERFYHLLSDSGKPEINAYTESFNTYFGPEKCKEDLEFTFFNNVDVLFDNVFLDGTQFIISDYEWTTDCMLPIQFIFWRSVNQLYKRYSYLNDFILYGNIYQYFNITDEKLRSFYSWEKHFSLNYVKMMNLEKYQKRLIKPDNMEEIFDEKSFISNVYIDSGSGFNDTEKFSHLYSVKETGINLEFDLSSFENIKAIRFDPIEGRLCKCSIQKATLNEVNCDFLAYNKFPFVHAMNEDIFLTVDPIYIMGKKYIPNGALILKIHFSIQLIKESEIFDHITEGIESELAELYSSKQKNQNLLSLIESLKAEYGNALNEKEEIIRIIKKEHDEIIDKLRAEHNEIIDKLKAEHDEIIDKLKAEHDEIIHQLESDYEQLSKERDQLVNEKQFLYFQNDALSEENRNLLAERDSVALEKEYILSSFCWKITKPVRFTLDIGKKGLKRLIYTIREMRKLIRKTIQNIKSYGLRKTVKKIFIKSGECLSNVKEQGIIAEKVQTSDIWNTIEGWIDDTPHKFIDIFHVPMGWHTPLFQRFQHLSLQAGEAGGISFYGAHPLVDKNIDICEFVTPRLCVLNLDNYEVKQRLFEILDRKPGLKFIRLQSIDLATTIDELESFLAKGYEIVYEYIDEITPQIVGNIPQFVLDRHEYVLKNERITVIPTSDKLYEQASRYRSSNMEMINNGVSYEHWDVDKNLAECPDDIKDIVNLGKIIIGYHGALAQWIDYELLKWIAEDKRFVILLIGFEHDDYLRGSGVLDRENVYFIGSRPYNDLARYAAFYDIAILPFIKNEITKSVSPVKIFEYMALAKPIVTYSLPECTKYRSCICADTREEFIAAIEKALYLRTDKKYCSILKKEALDNTWQSVMNRTVALVEKNRSRFIQSQPDSQKRAEPVGNKADFQVPCEQTNDDGKKIHYRLLKRLYYSIPFLSKRTKEEFILKIKRRFFPSMLQEEKEGTASQPGNSVQGPVDSSGRQSNYINQILSIPDKSSEYVPLTNEPHDRHENDCKVIAYYLTQFHPDRHNEKWWGKGVTEWSNVCRAVPQYVGHYQPRLPGELGFYDLRIRDNMVRQIELAKMHGVYGFSFYYYWFNGERLLEKPLEAFLTDKSLDFPFSLCWANENWTKRFDGTNFDILMEQPKSLESYKTVIKDIVRFLRDDRYITIKGKKVITVYRPDLMPDPAVVLEYWRDYCRRQSVGDLYIMAVKVNMVDLDLLSLGYDAITEFHPGTLYTNCKNITNEIEYIQPQFGGEVFDYKDIVENQKYFRYDLPKLYRAVMPMWDNTARRNNKGMIFHGSTPALYKKWLIDLINAGKTRTDIEDNIIFVNAWNEWGEGTYLEPDRRYGYAYLQATKEAVEETRN